MNYRDSFPMVVWDDITNIRNWVHRRSTLASQRPADFSWGLGQTWFLYHWRLKWLSSTPFFPFLFEKDKHEVGWLNNDSLEFKATLHPPGCSCFVFLDNFFSAEKFYQQKSVQTWKIQVWVFFHFGTFGVGKTYFCPAGNWMVNCHRKQSTALRKAVRKSRFHRQKVLKKADKSW